MVDDHAATELKLYIDNDGNLYRQQTTSILKNLMTKRARGVYKHDLAVKLFGHLVEEGAKKYAQEFGVPRQPWGKMFNAKTRQAVAEELTKEFETEAKLGNYDQLLPKKYQGQKSHKGGTKTGRYVSSGPAHARKKSGRVKILERVESPLKRGVYRIYEVLWYRSGAGVVRSLVNGSVVAEYTPGLGWEDHGRLPEDVRRYAEELAGDGRRSLVGHAQKAGRFTPARPRTPAELDYDIVQAIGPQAYAMYRGRR